MKHIKNISLAPNHMKASFLVVFLIIFFINCCSSVNGRYYKALISSADLLSSQIGIGILKKGGNAFDAAVAVQFALAVRLPRAGNIGGGGFAVIRTHDGMTYTLDYRETAPSSITQKIYISSDGEVKENVSLIGAKAVGVPGTVAGMVALHKRFGKLPWQKLLEPAIKLAKDGYALSQSQAKYLNNYASAFIQFSSSKQYFMPTDKKEFKEGDLFKQQDLGLTLERISMSKGVDFYNGKTAKMIVNTMKTYGGIITLEDISSYKPVWREPLVFSFKGNRYTIIGMPPPSSGGIMIAQILRMIESRLSNISQSPDQSYIHLVAQAMHRSFADRAIYIGDPGFYDVPVEELLSEDYLSARMESFVPESTQWMNVKAGVLPIIAESMETTHFSIVDQHSNAIAVTTTLNSSFGSKLAVDQAGFLLNNEIDDFSISSGKPNQFGLVGSSANKIEPRKRMLSSMSPIIFLKDGELLLVSGGAGGPRIITAVLEVFLNHVLFGMPIDNATHFPRFHMQWPSQELYVEEQFPIKPFYLDQLNKIGYQIKNVPYLARTHSVMKTIEGHLEGSADLRADGGLAGY